MIAARSYPTRPDEVSFKAWHKDAWGRRLIMLVLLAIVVAALLGFLGGERGTVEDSGGGYRLEVGYASTSRAGLSSPWNVRVEHPGGFDGPVTLATTQEYFTMFDENGFFPEPSSMTTKGGFVMMEFDPPEGNTLSVHLDTRIEPAVHTGESAQTQLIVGGVVVAQVRYTTTVAP